MKILSKYLTKEILGPFLFGLFAFLSIFSGLLFIDLLKDAQQYHLTFFFILKLLLLKLPEYVTQCTPIAVLLAALLGLGKLTSHSETIAMRAGGLTYSKLAAPVLVLGLVVSITGVLFNQYLVPFTNRAFDKLEREAASKEATSIIYHFKQDFFTKGALDKRIYARRYDPRAKVFHSLNIIEFNQGKASRLIEAAEMHWQDGEGWIFENGIIYQFLTDSFYSVIIDKGRVQYQLNLTPGEIKQLDEDPEYKSITELRKYIDRFFPEGDKRRELLVELHTKFALPFASFVFALLGTPLALKPQRRSNAAGFGLCIIFILIWYSLMGVGNALGRSGTISPFIGAWLPNFVLAGYGLYVFVKVKN